MNALDLREGPQKMVPVADPDEFWKFCREFGELLLKPASCIVRPAKPGDHIFYQVKQGYYHHGVYVESANDDGETEAWVIENNNVVKGSQGGSELSSIQKVRYGDFAKNGAIYVMIYTQDNGEKETDEDTKKRLRSAQDKAKKTYETYRGNVYNISTFNCHHFAAACHTGRLVGDDVVVCMPTPRATISSLKEVYLDVYFESCMQS